MEEWLDHSEGLGTKVSRDESEARTGGGTSWYSISVL